MSTHMLDQVADFHRAFQVPAFSALQAKVDRLAMVALRATLIEEEANEVADAAASFFRAPSDETRAHVAKELADLLYVTAGTAEVFRLDLADVKGDAGHPLATAFAMLKWRVARADEELTEILAMVDQEEATEDISDAIDDLGPVLQSVVQQVANVAVLYRIPIQEVYTRVHLSNMSKVNPATGKPDIREDGKVLKGPWYHEPELLDLFKHPAARLNAA